MPNFPTEQARRELESILADGSSDDAYNYKVRTVWAWHLRHSPRDVQKPEVGRDEISRLLWPSPMNNLLCIKFGSPQQANKLVDDLLALLSQGSGPVWCSHIVWCAEVKRWFKNDERFNSGSIIANNVPDEWDICPVAGCHAKRPEGGDEYHL